MSAKGRAWTATVVTCAVAGVLVAAGCTSDASGPSEVEWQEAEARCERFGGVEEVVACLPPDRCACGDGGKVPYRGVSCTAVCRERGGEVSDRYLLPGFFRWTGGEVRCADGTRFSLSLHGCMGYVTESSALGPEA